MKQLLAAIDFSKSSDPVLEQAAELAKSLQAKLWVLHVASEESQAIAYESIQYTDYSPDFVGIPGDVQLADSVIRLAPCSGMIVPIPGK